VLGPIFYRPFFDILAKCLATFLRAQVIYVPEIHDFLKYVFAISYYYQLVASGVASMSAARECQLCQQQQVSCQCQLPGCHQYHVGTVLELQLKSPITMNSTAGRRVAQPKPNIFGNERATTAGARCEAKQSRCEGGAISY
jgi:hypothetical protein